MTDPEALAGEDLSTPWYAADGDWDGFALDDWGAYPAEPPPPPTPWFRNPRPLFGLIGVAAAALVVATVLLITGKQSGEMPTAPVLSTRTAPDTPGARSTPRPPSPSASETTSSATSSSSSSAESPSSDAEEDQMPAEPQQPAESPAGPPPAPSTGADKSPAGPKINVTRTPMSFTPDKH